MIGSAGENNFITITLVESGNSQSAQLRNCTGDVLLPTKKYYAMDGLLLHITRVNCFPLPSWHENRPMKKTSPVCELYVHTQSNNAVKVGGFACNDESFIGPSCS